MMPQKSIFASKTFWVNAATAETMLLAEPSVSSVIPAKYVVIGMAAANIGLRLLTTDPAGLVAQK